MQVHLIYMQWGVQCSLKVLIVVIVRIIQRKRQNVKLSFNCNQQIFFWVVLRALTAPNGHQGGSQGSSEGQLDSCGSITEVGAAAPPGDGVSGSQEGSWFSLIAEGRGQAALRLKAH